MSDTVRYELTSERLAHELHDLVGLELEIDHGHQHDVIGGRS